jgi:hypothetical protein
MFLLAFMGWSFVDCASSMAWVEQVKWRLTGGMFKPCFEGLNMASVRAPHVQGSEQP